MKNLFFSIVAVATLSACALIAPYQITFTTPNGKVVNPAVDTLDLAINQPVLAYISGLDCGGTPMQLLPAVNNDMEYKQAHNLSLTLLDGQAAGTECKVTVTAFDQTTTSNASASITLYVLAHPDTLVMPEPAPGQDENAEGAENVEATDEGLEEAEAEVEKNDALEEPETKTSTEADVSPAPETPADGSTE